MNDLAKMKNDEWLEADSLGGFASGTVSGIGTRRYHPLLLDDADPPHTPRGCPFQAWSVAEALHLDRLVLTVREKPKSASSRARATSEA